MEVIIYLVPPSLLIGALLLYAFFWALKNDQYEDLDSPADRILHVDERNKDD